jgi:hypothetical protein
MVLDLHARPVEATPVEHFEQGLEPSGMFVIDGQIDHAARS